MCLQTRLYKGELVDVSAGGAVLNGFVGQSTGEFVKQGYLKARLNTSKFVRVSRE